MTTFTVNKPARTKGSKTRGVRNDGTTFMRESGKYTKPFMRAVRAAAIAARCPLLEGDVLISVVCEYRRPKSHYRANGFGLLASAPVRPWKGDSDKIARSVLDSLPGVCYANDKQVRAHAVACAYGFEDRVIVEVVPCPASGAWKFG